MDARRSRVRRLRMAKREGERSFGMTLEQPKFRLHMQFPSVSYVSPQLAADRAGIKPGIKGEVVVIRCCDLCDLMDWSVCWISGYIVRSVGYQCVQGLTVADVASLFRGVVEVRSPCNQLKGYARMTDIIVLCQVEIEIEDIESSNSPTISAASLEQPTTRNPFDPFQARPAAGVAPSASANGSAAVPFSTEPSRAISNASVNAPANRAPPLPGYSAALTQSAMVSASASFAENIVTQSIQVLGAAAYAVGSQSMPKPPGPRLIQSIQVPAPEAREAPVVQQSAAPHSTPNATAAMVKAPAPQTVQQPATQHPTPVPVAQPVVVSTATTELSQASQVKQPALTVSQQIPPVVQPAAPPKLATEPIKDQAMKQSAPVLKVAAPDPTQSNVQSKQPALPKPQAAVPQQRAPSSQYHVNGLAQLHVSQNPAHQSAALSQQTAPVQRTAKEIGEKKLTPAAAANGLKSPQKASAMTKQPAVATPSRTAHTLTSASVESTAEHKGSKKRSRRESVDTTTPRSQSKQARYKRNFIDDSSDLEDVPDEEGKLHTVFCM